MAHSPPVRPLRPRRVAGFPLLLAVLGALGLGPAAAAAAGAPAPAAERWPHAADVEKGALAALFRTTLAAGGAGKVAVTSGDYNVDTCRLALDVDVAAKHVRGVMAMRLHASAPELTRVVLDLIDSLTVDSVRTDRGPAAFTHAGDTLAVDLGFTLTKGQATTVSVWYSGRPAADYDFGFTWKIHHYSTPDPSDDGPLAASLSEPEYAHWWWPCKDRPDDKFISEVTVTVPTGLVAVSNGTLYSSATPPGLPWTWEWRSAHPIASYLVAVSVSDYVTFGETCQTAASGPIPLQNWVFPADRARAEIDFAPLCGMVNFLEQRLGGWPFPGEKYGHVEFLWGGAMENQTCTSYGNLLLTGTNAYATIVLHELAHQWFGDSVTPRGWADVWLNEGFATYAEALWAEEGGGAVDYHAFLDSHRSLTDWIGESTVYDPFPIFPGRVIYDKGAWILHMLRGRMGDAAFADLLRAWAAGSTRRLGHGDTAEFIALAETYAGEPLGAFFTPWLETDQVPRLLWRQEALDGAGGPGTTLRLTLAQTQPALFDNVYPVRVTTAAGVQNVRARLDAREAVFTFALDGALQAVAIDPEHWVCWRAGVAPPAAVGITGIYPNPAATGPVSVAFRLAEPAEVSLRVFDARGRLVAERGFGAREPLLTDDVVTWDGRDGAGRRAGAGVYWAQLRMGGRTAVRKFALVP
ncbi:MAG: M1 family metallopeptidase [Candidatus Krumholzibacteriia bacterium]